jgi:ribA/ribD-fused uncharacterized protein
MAQTIFVSDVDWLRNDYEGEPIGIGAYEFVTVEHAYQAAKFKDPKIKQEIADSETVKEARKIGRKGTIRPDWDQIRLTVMENLLRQKFSSDSGLENNLIVTNDAEIVMRGYDNFWGQDEQGNGENHLGKLLMKIRAEKQMITGYEIPDEVDSEDDAPALKEALENGDDELFTAVSSFYHNTKKIFELYDRLQDATGMHINSQNLERIISQMGERHRPLVTEYVNKLDVIQSEVKKIDSLLHETESSEDVARKAINDDDEDDYDYNGPVD